MVRWLNLIFAAASLLVGVPSRAADKVVLQLGWAAEPEFGGFLEAKQAGIYDRYGLDVQISFGSAQLNATQLLLAGQADFINGPASYALNALARGFPLVVVAAIYQKSPNVLIAHQRAGNETLQSLRHRPVMIAFSDLVTFWPFLKARFGFDDSQIRPYNFNLGPFLHDPDAVQQGYITEEPFLLRQEGAAITVFPLADYGYDTYASTIITTPRLIARRPDLVRRFVAASIAGWDRYLHGDPTPANAAIKVNNPQISDRQMAFAIDIMKTQGLLQPHGADRIGAMSDQRWAAMVGQMKSLGLYPAHLDFHQAYTLEFLGPETAR